MIAVLFIFLLMNRLMTDLQLNADPFLALIIVITSSWLMLPPDFFYQQFALCFWFACVYLIYLLMVTPQNSGLLISLLILSCALVITHGSTPLFLLFYLLFLAILFFIKTRRFFRPNIPNIKTGVNPQLWVDLSLCFGAVLGFWWIYFSTGIWAQMPSRIQYLWNAITTGEFQIYSFQEYGASPPKIDYPLWGTLALTVRDGITIIGVIVGFIFIFFKFRQSHARTFLLSSLVFAGILTVVDVLFIKVATYREIGMFIPFWTLCAVAAFALWERFNKRLVVLLNAVVVIIVVFAALTGQWGNRYLPVFLYDPNVSAVQSGDHSLDWKYVNNTLGNKLNFNMIDRIITDEKYDASLIVPIDDWTKIEVAGLNDTPVSDSTVTFMFRDFNIRQTYIEQAMGINYDPLFNATNFIADLNAHSNLIYTTDTTQVWIGGY